MTYIPQPTSLVIAAPKATTRSSAGASAVVPLHSLHAADSSSHNGGKRATPCLGLGSLLLLLAVLPSCGGDGYYSYTFGAYVSTPCIPHSHHPTSSTPPSRSTSSSPANRYFKHQRQQQRPLQQTRPTRVMLSWENGDQCCCRIGYGDGDGKYVTPAAVAAHGERLGCFSRGRRKRGRNVCLMATDDDETDNGGRGGGGGGSASSEDEKLELAAEVRCYILCYGVLCCVLLRVAVLGCTVTPCRAGWLSDWGVFQRLASACVGSVTILATDKMHPAHPAPILRCSTYRSGTTVEYEHVSSRVALMFMSGLRLGFE